MKTPTSIIKQYALALFCGLTIALTFATTLLPLPGELVAVVMVFIPALLAISLTAVSEGRAGVRSLLGKLAHWRIGLKWVGMALVLALVVRLTMSLIALSLGMISTIQLRPGGPAQYVILAAVFFVFAIPEELGWRGYALPKLLERHSPLAAGLMVGALWGSLHLALLLPDMMNEGASPLATLLGLLGGSVLFTWLYVNSGGSILLTTLFHAAQSFFVIVNEGLTGPQQAWLMAGVYLAVALIVVLATGPRLTRRPMAR
ncbi:MAG TPA: CPBP family intramembrane glutamic endopeptidase, partial [Anaerolineales bacterium]|nr:CPBP family intramembrane glutamic endopeptidase [Anaerolineales bacterium]